MSPRKRPSTHSENRLKVCAICKKKQKSLQKLQATIITILETNSIYKNKDHRFPAAICVGCKFKVTKANDEKLLCDIIPSYAEFNSERLLRQSGSGKICNCALCKIARRNCVSKVDRNSNVVRLASKKKILRNVQLNNEASSTVQVYDELKTRFDNDLTTIDKERLLCQLIKSVKKKKSSKEELLSLSQTRGKPLRVSVNPRNQSVSQISASDVIKIQTSYGLSSNLVRGITRDLRCGAKNRKLFEPNLRQKVSASSHTLDALFTVQTNDFVHVLRKKRTVVQQPFVFCTNIKKLCEIVQEKRECSSVHLKFGIDGGGGFLKITLSVQDTQTGGDNDSQRRQRYHDGLSSKLFKDSGVKKLFLVGLAPETQENYENVRELWSLLKINRLDRWTVATDLKLANILMGIMTHASNHPCTWCNALKGLLNQCGKYRTFGSCINNYNAWQKTGRKQTKAKDYENCINLPVLEGDDEDEVIDYIPPPELHLLTGIVNKLYDHMLVEFEEDTIKWTKVCNVQRNVAYGHVAFAGINNLLLLSFPKLIFFVNHR